MTALSPFSSLEDTIKNVGSTNSFSEFFEKMKRKDEDCPEDDDCGEVTSSCCNVKVETIFGSLPLKVKCTECGVQYLLRDLIL